MEHLTETLIKLIGSEVCGSVLSLPAESVLSDSFLAELFGVSKAHDVNHLVGSALINNGLLEGRGIEKQFRDRLYITLFRYENLDFVLKSVCSSLEKAKIPYIMLKGSVIRKLYPQAWMRTGCDIDILVHEEDIEKAAKAISALEGYERRGTGKHDASILSAQGIYVELHFSLIEEEQSQALARVLNKVWEHAMPTEGGGYEYELDDEMFYFYHVAHMAKHFVQGGCGLRPFLDLWLMGRSKNYHTPETDRLLKKGGLVNFAKTAEQLSEIWFSGNEHSETTLLMEDYIMSGGCFGSAQTRMLSSRQRSGGKTKYILSRIFVPYNDLKGQYPIIQKYRFLTPLCEICRLFSLLFGKKKKFRRRYLGSLKNVSEAHIDNINLLFERVGL